MFDPEKSKLKVEGAEMLAIKLRLTKTTMMWFEPIIQYHGSFLNLMPFRTVIVTKMPAQFLSAAEHFVTGNAPRG